MQTPIQQLISKLKNSNPKIDFLTWFQSEAVQKKLIKSEKQAFKDFYNQGYRDGERTGELTKDIADISTFSNAENYYNDTFNKDKP